MVYTVKKGVIKMMELPKLLSKADMAKRWEVTSQVVHNWEKRHDNFPEPVMRVHDDKLPLYLLEDVVIYEKTNHLIKKSVIDD